MLVRETDSVGAAANLGFHLSRSGIDILYSYASSSGSDEFWAVFKTTDDDRAIRVLSATERRRDVA